MNSRILAKIDLKFLLRPDLRQKKNAFLFNGFYYGSGICIQIPRTNLMTLSVMASRFGTVFFNVVTQNRIVTLSQRQ